MYACMVLHINFVWLHNVLPSLFCVWIEKMYVCMVLYICRYAWSYISTWYGSTMIQDEANRLFPYEPEGGEDTLLAPLASVPPPTYASTGQTRRAVREDKYSRVLNALAALQAG
ncbi:hypothetical protein Dimus_031457 [Dionaea muscipula]